MSVPDPLSVGFPRVTERLVLRELTLADTDAMLAYRSDPLVTRFLAHPPLTREAVELRIRWRLRGEDPTPGRFLRGVGVECDGRLIGDAMLRVQAAEPDDSPAGLRLWLGYAFHRDVWGEGYATETVRALVAVGHELGLPLRADTLPGNVASQRVLLKAGFVDVGERGPADDRRRLFRLG